MPTSRSAREAFDAISFRLAPNPDGHTSSRARLGAGALVRVGVLSILQVLREEPFAPSLSAVPHAPAPTAERTELARPDVGEPLALLVRHARESCSFPLEGRDILVGGFDAKQKDHEAREAERLLHVPDASVSRRRRSIHADGPTIDLLTVRELTNQPPEDDALAALVGRASWSSEGSHHCASDRDDLGSRYSRTSMSEGSRLVELDWADDADGSRHRIARNLVTRHGPNGWSNAVS